MPFAHTRRLPSRQAQHRVSHRIVAALVLIGLFALPSYPDPREGGAGPDATDLRTYLACSMAADVRLLGFDEATLCSTVFMRIKLSLMPDIDLDTFNALMPAEKSAIDRLGYRRYLDWKQQNADVIDALMTEISASQADG